MKGEDNFFFRGSSLNDICLYLKQKYDWIHHRKVLNSLCSLSCIVPFHYTTAFSFNHAFTVQINLSTIHAALGSGFIDAYNFVHKNGFCSVNVTRFSKTYFISNNEIKEFSGWVVWALARSSGGRWFESTHSITKMW